MRFPRFWRSWGKLPRGDADDDLEQSLAFPDSGLADEVEALLAGRLVDHMTAARQPVSAWAVLNRLAHADWPDLMSFVEGGTIADGTVHPPSSPPSWAPAERFVAGRLLALATAPDDLRVLQHATLVPLELGLIERCKVERFTADQILDLGEEALDSFHQPR